MAPSSSMSDVNLLVVAECHVMAPLYLLQEATVLLMVTLCMIY